MAFCKSRTDFRIFPSINKRIALKKKKKDKKKMYTTINYNVTFFLLFFFTLIFLHLISFKLTNFINHVPISPMKRVNDTFSNLWHTVTWCRVAGGGSSRINPSLNTNPLFEHVVHCVQYTRTYISNNMTLKADCFFFFFHSSRNRALPI